MVIHCSCNAKYTSKYLKFSSSKSTGAPIYLEDGKITTNEKEKAHIHVCIYVYVTTAV